MEIQSFFDPETFTLTYIVFDPTTKDAVIIDPVLDYDAAGITTSTQSIEKLLDFVGQQGLLVHSILETHAHADHLSGAHELVSHHFPNAQIAIGVHITAVQETFKKLLNFPSTFRTDGSQFHRLLTDNEVVTMGSLTFKVVLIPGHTPACASYLFKDISSDFVFTGDALFMPDYGTGRCDFPKGDAHALYRSISQRLYQLPDATRVFVGHDYQPHGRPLAFETTIGASKTTNIQLKATTSEEEFVTMRTTRDKTLAAPRLLFPSIQVNIAAGEFPDPESNGRVYLKLPVTRKATLL